MTNVPSCIEGFAIVSSDGMLAGADSIMPEALKFDADQKFFRAGLDRCEAVIHGRHSHEQQPNSPRRRRIWVTTRVAGLERDADDAMAVRWNPAGASFEQAWAALGLKDAALGVVGGTDVFGLFLPRYDVFHLTHAPGVTLPGGRPVFPGVPARTPEEIMRDNGLAAGTQQLLDAGSHLTVTSWRRAPR
jgi:dihydrofolate reductase